jgi:hypothetical protein
VVSSRLSEQIEALAAAFARSVVEAGLDLDSFEEISPMNVCDLFYPDASSPTSRVESRGSSRNTASSPSSR